MASMLMRLLLATFLLSETTISLQVSSASPCTSLCLDAGPNTLNSSTPNTSGGDITCQDNDYTKTESGQKFISCVSCLQTSTASDEYGSDQEWFLYNLRFALDSCLYGFQQPVDFIPGPCTTSQACLPLQLAIEDGNHIPSNESEYSYCSADENSILGASLNQCRDCLSGTANEKYLRNFLTALQAGCVQQPGTGILIGLEGNVFSDVPVNITFPGYHQTPTATPGIAKKGGLSQGAIIGVAVGLAVLLLLTIAILVICSRRRRNLNRLRKLKLESSPLDSRFGTTNIISSANGSYGNQYGQPQVSANGHYDGSMAKELTVMDNVRHVQEKYQASPQEFRNGNRGWMDGAHARLAGQLPNHSRATILTNAAHIPTAWSPISPADSTATSETYPLKDDTGFRPSYKHVPPPLILAPRPPAHKRKTSGPTQPQVPQMQTIHSPLVLDTSSPETDFQPQFHQQLRSEARNRSHSRPRNGSRTRNESKTRPESRSTSRAESRADSRVVSRAGSRSRAESREQSRTRSRDNSLSRPAEESSRVSPPGLHSQKMATMADDAPSRSGSRADSYKRITSRPGISNTNASKDEPLVKLPSYDFEAAERGRLEEGLASLTKDSFKKKKKVKTELGDATSINTDGEEQWPGTY